MSTAIRGIQYLPHLRRLGIDRVGPAWYASVMGTGILAIVATISPIPVPFGRPIGVVLWSADTVLFAIVSILWSAKIARTSHAFTELLRDPVGAQILGAPPMACFTIAVGFLKIGESSVPLEVCIAAAQTLFVFGVLGSIASAIVVPYTLFTRHEIAPKNGREACYSSSCRRSSLRFRRRS